MGDAWESLFIGDLLTLEYGKALRARDYDRGEYPVFGAAGVIGWHSVPLVTDAPNVIVGRKGTAGAVSWCDSRCWPIDTTYYVRLKRHVMPEFVYLLLQGADLPSISAQTGTPGLNRDRAYELPVLLPPLAEQRRIVDLIGAVDTAAAAARAEAEAARQAHVAVREESLGAIDENVPVGDLLEGIDAGRSPAAEDRSPEPGEACVLKVSAIRPGRFDRSQVKVLADTAAFPPSALVRDGDLLMTRANGNRDLLGVACIARNPYPDCYLSDKTLRLVPRDGSASREYLMELLLSFGVREQIGLMGTGTASMKNISQSSIRKLHIPVPDVEEQARLASLLGAIRDASTEAEALSTATGVVRASLLQGLLTGSHSIPTTYDRFLDDAA